VRGCTAPFRTACFAKASCDRAHAAKLRGALTPDNDLCNNAPNSAYPGDRRQYPVTSVDGGKEYNAHLRYDFARQAMHLLAGDLFGY
jgi:hypothetical protein